MLNFNRFLSNNLPATAEIVIAGGGVIGSSIAYHFSKLGWKDIALFEQGRYGVGKKNIYQRLLWFNSFAFKENAKFDFFQKIKFLTLKLNISVLTNAKHVKFVLILKLFS